MDIELADPLQALFQCFIGMVGKDSGRVRHSIDGKDEIVLGEPEGNQQDYDEEEDENQAELDDEVP